MKFGKNSDFCLYVRFLSIKKLHLQNTRYGDLFSPICQHSPFRSLYKGVSGNIWLTILSTYFYHQQEDQDKVKIKSHNLWQTKKSTDNVAATMVLILNYKQHHKAFNILVLFYHGHSVHCDTLTPSKFHFALQCYLVLNLKQSHEFSTIEIQSKRTNTHSINNENI